MTLFIKVQKKKDTVLRKIPWLPRIGIYFDAFGYELVAKHVPTIETALNLLDRGLKRSHLKNITKEQFEEIQFPKKIVKRVIKTTAKILSVKDL